MKFLDSRVKHGNDGVLGIHRGIAAPTSSAGMTMIEMASKIYIISLV